MQDSCQMIVGWYSGLRFCDSLCDLLESICGVDNRESSSP